MSRTPEAEEAFLETGEATVETAGASLEPGEASEISLMRILAHVEASVGFT